MPKPQAATEQVTIVESLAGVGATVDMDAAVIKGVKLIGFESRNGRYYPPDVLRASVGLYEGVKVNIDHPKNPGDPRSVHERFGKVQNARYVEGKGVFGDVKYNPKHHLAEQVAWDAEHNSDAVGFSHNATLKIGARSVDGKRAVESIVGVRSLDLVADPATTSGFFEHEEANQTPEEETMDLKNLTLEELRTARPDLIEAATEQVSESQELEQLRTKVATLEAEKAKAKLQADVQSALEAAGFDTKDKKQVSDLFLSQLLEAKDETARTALIEDRKSLVGAKGTAATEGRKGESPRTSTVTEGKLPTDSDGWRKRILSRSRVGA